MKKYFFIVVISLLSLTLIACSSSSPTTSSSYKLETGEILTVKINAEFEQLAEIPFQIKKDDKVIFIGNFLTKDWCLEYIEQSSKNKTMIKDGMIEGNYYYLFKDEALDEYEYLLLIHDSEIAASLVSNQELEDIEDCFQHIKVFQVTK